MNTHDRFSRQSRLSEIGQFGADKIANAHVMIVGMGALGTHLASLFCRSGVSELTIIDRDVVELSNIQRQVLFNEEHAQLSVPKVEAAKKQLLSINSALTINTHVAEFNAEFIRIHPDLTNTVDVILDGVDNFEARYLINELAIKCEIPYIYAGAVGMEGCCFPIIPNKTACLSCLMQSTTTNTTQATCAITGVLSSAISHVTSLQFTEAIKILVGDHAALKQELYFFNLWNNTQLNLPVPIQNNCPTCQKHHFPIMNGEKENIVKSICGKNAVQLYNSSVNKDFIALQAVRLMGYVKAKSNFHLEVNSTFQDDDYSVSLFPDGRLVVEGTDNEIRAKQVVSETLGV